MNQAADLRSLMGRLRDAVARLAAAPEDQLQYLATLGVDGSADELALEFDDIYRPAQPLLDQVAAPDDVRIALQRLDGRLGRSTIDWSTRSLAESEDWAETRRLAAQALGCMKAWRSE